MIGTIFAAKNLKLNIGVKCAATVDTTGDATEDKKCSFQLVNVFIQFVHWVFITDIHCISLILMCSFDTL